VRGIESSKGNGGSRGGHVLTKLTVEGDNKNKNGVDIKGNEI